MKTIVSVLLTAIFSVSVMAQSPVNLKYNLEKNKVYKAKTIVSQNQKRTMQGVDQVIEVENTLYLSMKALSLAPDFFMAEVKFDTIKNSVSMPKMEFSSAIEGNIKSDNTDEIMNCVLNRLSKSTLLVKMAYSGHVIDIMNQPVVAKTVLMDVDSIKGQNAVMLKPRIEMMVQKEDLKSMVENITVLHPNKKVNKGEKWNTQFTSSNGGFGFLISTDYTLNETKGNEAIINGEVNLEPAAMKPMEMNGAKITMELRGKGQTEMNVDANTGWVINGKSEIQMSGNMNVEAQGQSFPIPMEITMTTETIGLN
jgi:hypothetical protein